jgi:hypothetical protein
MCSHARLTGTAIFLEIDFLALSDASRQHYQFMYSPKVKLLGSPFQGHLTVIVQFRESVSQPNSLRQSFPISARGYEPMSETLECYKINLSHVSAY